MEVETENVRSRIYLGIHCAFNVSKGINQGSEVAAHMISNGAFALSQCRKPTSRKPVSHKPMSLKPARKLTIIVNSKDFKDFSIIVNSKEVPKQAMLKILRVVFLGEI